MFPFYPTTSRYTLLFCWLIFQVLKTQKVLLLQSESVNRFIKACCKNKQWSEGRRLKQITLIKYVLAKFQDFLNPKSLILRFKSYKILNSKKFEEQQKKWRKITVGIMLDLLNFPVLVLQAVKNFLQPFLMAIVLLRFQKLRIRRKIHPLFYGKNKYVVLMIFYDFWYGSVENNRY